MAKPVDKCAQWPLEAAIWENEKDGEKYYNVTLNRSYTVDAPDGGKKEYKTTPNLREQDLLLASELMRLAWYKIRTLKQ